MIPPSFFDFDERLKGLGDIGDPVGRQYACGGTTQQNFIHEKQVIKSGKIVSEIWQYKPNKAQQKDVNARWTVTTPWTLDMKTGSRVWADSAYRPNQNAAIMGMTIRTIGIARARTKTGMASIVYNMRRLVHLTKAVPA